MRASNQPIQPGSPTHRDSIVAVLELCGPRTKVRKRLLAILDKPSMAATRREAIQACVASGVTPPVFSRHAPRVLDSRRSWTEFATISQSRRFGLKRDGSEEIVRRISKKAKHHVRVKHQATKYRRLD